MQKLNILQQICSQVVDNSLMEVKAFPNAFYKEKQKPVCLSASAFIFSAYKHSF